MTNTPSWCYKWPSHHLGQKNCYQESDITHGRHFWPATAGKEMKMQMIREWLCFHGITLPKLLRHSHSLTFIFLLWTSQEILISVSMLFLKPMVKWCNQNKGMFLNVSLHCEFDYLSVSNSNIQICLLNNRWMHMSACTEFDTVILKCLKHLTHISTHAYVYLRSLKPSFLKPR